MIFLCYIYQHTILSALLVLKSFSRSTSHKIYIEIKKGIDKNKEHPDHLPHSILRKFPLIFDTLTLPLNLPKIDLPLKIWMFIFHMLSHRSFSPVALITPWHRTYIIPLYLIRTSPYPLLILIR